MIASGKHMFAASRKGVAAVILSRLRCHSEEQEVPPFWAALTLHMVTDPAARGLAE